MLGARSGVRVATTGVDLGQRRPMFSLTVVAYNDVHTLVGENPGEVRFVKTRFCRVGNGTDARLCLKPGEMHELHLESTSSSRFWCSVHMDSFQHAVLGCIN